MSSGSTLSRIVVHVDISPQMVAKTVAQVITSTIQKNDAAGKPTVLCLPTGSTPIPVYRELIALHSDPDVGLSFKNVYTFNLDEYYPMEKTHEQSYHRYMWETFFSKLKDIDPDKVHIPRGDLPRGDYEAYCSDFEGKIDALGGFDIALVGIGRTGHIGFNEPGSKGHDPTRLVVLHNQTRRDNSRFFASLDDVPMYAVTQGIGTVMKAKRVILIATGFHKSKIVLTTLEDPKVVMTHCPAAFLRSHENCQFHLDTAAAYRLREVKTPWLVRNPVTFEWTPKLRLAAVIWLSKITKKVIMSLTENDFCDNGLSGLLYHVKGDYKSLCENVFDDLLNRIHRNAARSSLLPMDASEKILFFSPHPDDDAMCLGGTIAKLSRARRGKNMKVVYMTSGSRGVSTNDLKHHLRFTSLSLPGLQIADAKAMSALASAMGEVKKLQKEESADGEDTALMQMLKTNVRKAEATNSLEILGLREEDSVWLDLPFYHTGKNKKLPMSDLDVDIAVKCLERERPDHIFVCSDLEDVHGTHGVCYRVMLAALDRYGYEGLKGIYLYKGLWQDFNPPQVTVYVPLNSEELDVKLRAIFCHQSQQNRPMFPGDDKRQFFERAIERNRSVVELLQKMGLPAYHAAETLQRVVRLPADLAKLVF